ncbi:cilia- and flagella-associated protein 46 [Mergus octosetaceus]
MDVAVRERLLAAQSRRDVQALKDAYELIKSACQGRSALDSSDNFSTDLYVLCAEQAFQLGYLQISSDCLQMYFKGRFPVNQFIGRAYLCQGQLHTPLSTDNLEAFEKFVLFFMKAIDFATHDQRYYFLIYNASVLYWQFVRPYLKPGFRCYLVPSLLKIVKALNQTDEPDSEWRAELMINLLECLLDASKLKEAKEFSSTAAVFIKENVPDKYSQIFSLMVYHKLMDISQIEKEIQNSIHLSVIYKMQMIKSQWDTNEFPSDATATLYSLYELLKQYDVPPASVASMKIPLILELARFSVKVNCIKLTHDCILELKKAGITEQGKLIEVECLECEYEIQKFGPKIVTYTKGVVEAQRKLIKNLELTLQHAVQLGDPYVIQVVCTTQWNLCLPLLQQNLHQHVRKPLIAVADVLEEIDSMLILLRCQVHMEIARIEEDEDRIEIAVQHLQKAIHLDKSGQYQEHLRLNFNRLSLYAMLYKSPERLEDQALMMIEQAKRGKEKNNVRQKRSLLVNAGLALAPDSFQVVLDSENEAKVSSGKSQSQVSYLCAKAQHHVKSVDKVDGHLKHLKKENDKERIRLWANLAKVARTQEVWDVCRTACRFCLLYDDTLFRRATKPKKTQKKKASITMMDDDQGDGLPGELLLLAKSFSFERDLLRILAEIRFINAEATIHLLRLQGIELNDHTVPTEDKSQCPSEYVLDFPESDLEWKAYSLWIDYLSQYAMENFLRAAEIGEELNEAWIVHNAVVYILNYNRHLITSGRQREIIAYLQTLLGAVKTVGHTGSTVTLLMLCNAVARGLILCWIPKPKCTEEKKLCASPDKSRKASAKGQEKANAIPSLSVDPSGLPDIKAALEICEFALNVTSGTIPNETVPVAVKQQIIATWVKVKQLNQQQIGHKLWTQEESNEAQNPIARILVGLEMYSCTGLGLMDFTVPALSQLVKLALECSWSDSLVELQTLTRLTYFAYILHDYEIVMTCSQRILQSFNNFFHNSDTKKYEIPDNTARQEMLSTAACIQGKSIMENLAGQKYLRIAASKAFAQSARYAGEAGNYSLVMFAARHFWNACLPLLGFPHDREQFKEPTEIILKNIMKAESENKQEKNDTLPLHQWLTKDFQSSGLSDGCFLPGADEDLTLRTSLYGLLFHIYADKSDWEKALKVLNEAIQALPQTRHRLLIFKHLATVKARLGCNFIMEIQKFAGESEDYVSRIWRHMVTVSRSIVEQLNCFKNAINALQKQENEWQKVDYLMEFAEWLYCNQFPLNDVIKPLDWAVGLLLHMKFSMQSSQEEEKKSIKKLLPMENLKIDVGRNDVMPQINLENLTNIKQLEALFRAQTLMAVVSGHSSPFHQQHCLMAYACVIRIWQVSLSASELIIGALSKSSQFTAPQDAQPTIAPKKEKDKKEEKQNPQSRGQKRDKTSKDTKQVEESFVKEQPKRKESVDTLPINVEEWAHYDCPNEVRNTFKQKTNSYGINWNNFTKPTCTLHFIDILAQELQQIFCPHLILPIFQLAEVIANEVVECRSLSDLYHLRIALICSDLKLSQASSYHEKAAGEAYISELEQIFELNAITGKGLSALSFPYLWIEKAEVLIQLGLYQPARLLLSQAYAATQELRTPYDASRCLYLLAVLANLEKKHRQAKALLEKAQILGGNEQFWYNSTVSLIEAILEEDGEEKQRLACKILEHTVYVLRSTLLKRPNRESELGFIIASLEARKALIEIHFAQNCMTINTESCQSPHMLQGSYNKLIQIEEDFLNYGHKNCSAEILLERANIHRNSGAKHKNEEEKHSHCLDAYNLAQMAVSKAEEVFHNVCSLIAVNENTNTSIPLMRQLGNRKLNLVEILLDIFQVVTTEKKLKQVGKTSFHRIAESFCGETTKDNATEQDWKHMEYTIGHITLAQLANILNLCKGCPDIKSKCLYLTGKCLHLLAINIDPVHSEIYWKPNIMKELRLAQKYLSQCSEALLQCMGIAFSYNITNVLGPASLEMVECFGQFDPVSTSQFLALHQSCSASMMMKHILLTANSDTSSSRLAALLHLQNQLKQNRNTSDLLKNVEQQLTATSMVWVDLVMTETHDLLVWSAWRNLCIPVEHFNIVNELPSNFYIIILQHSEDRSNLYSSLIEKPKVSTAQQKGKSTQPMVQAKVSRFPVNPNTFCTLLEKVYLYKQQNMKSHLKETAIQSLQECITKTDMTPTEKIDKNGHNLITDFSEILEIMEEYLKPLLSQFDFPNIREHSTSASAAESGKIKVKDKDTKHTRMQGTPMELGLCVVLLADKLFMELPLETLSVFQEEGICSVSRDFSLQILYNRLQVDESEALSPSQKMKEILEKYHDLFTLQWEGVIGNVYVPSQAEWEQLLTNCSAFLFYGMERFLSHILLNRLVAMNIPKCHLMILLDLVQSKQSYQRITNSDIYKSSLQFAIERPTETVMLLSLTGVRSIIANQWYTTLQENAERLEILFENLLHIGRTTGQTIRTLQKRKIHGEKDSAQSKN